MAAPPGKTEISDTYPNPTNATARAGFGKLWDYVTTLLGASGNAVDARAALGVVIGAHVQGFDANTAKTNAAQAYSKAQRGAVVPLTDGATITPDFSLSNNFEVQLAGSRTLANPANLVTGQSGIIDVVQDATGTRTLGYAWGYVTPGGMMAALSTAPGALDELAYYVKKYATAAVAITIATPGVVTWTAHGLLEGQRLQLATTGALPTGLAAATTYYVKYISANTFQLSATRGGAAIATSGTQSGAHTAEAITIRVSLGANVS